MIDPKPYDRIQVQGHTLDNITHAAVRAVEKMLGYELTILQGSYNGGEGAVSASGGTHDGGGAIDLAPADHEAKVNALRKVGFAAWYRPELWHGSTRIWGAHVHAILIGNKNLSDAAKRQVTSYLNRRNGLADNAPDNTWHPKPRVFNWELSLPKVNVSLKAVRADLKAVRDHSGTPTHNVHIKRLQRLLNRAAAHPVVVDGIAGKQTLNAWMETHRRLPNKFTLRKLLKGTRYRMVA